MTTQTVAVLAILLEDWRNPHYGLEIARGAGLRTGTVYPVLARLEQHGLVASAWEDIDPVAEKRPRRRYYKLTGDGVRVAQTEIRRTVERLQRVAGSIVPGGATS